MSQDSKPPKPSEEFTATTHLVCISQAEYQAQCAAVAAAFEEITVNPQSGAKLSDREADACEPGL